MIETNISSFRGVNISFSLNKENFQVKNVDPNISLNSWLRENCFTGSKVMCEQGGCGSCVVVVISKNKAPIAANSCLMPLYHVNGCSVFTSDGLGSMTKGFNQIQKSFVEHGATQCGYCTPGFITSVYSLLKSEGKVTEQDIEDHLDGHICRCTGYRSILDASKSLIAGKENITDIEDLSNFKLQNKKQNKSLAMKGKIQKSYITREISSTKLFQPISLDELKTFMNDSSKFTDSKVFLCAGTSKGIYQPSGGNTSALVVDLSQVPELLMQEVNKSKGLIEVGAGVSINQLSTLLSSNNENDNKIFNEAVKHLQKVAGNTIRNVASWAGNLMVKYYHREFPSDVAIILESLKAKLSIYDSLNRQINQYSIFGENSLMSTDMKKKVILSMEIPVPNDENIVYKTYKIMPRSQNSHAYINGAFSANVVNNKLIGQNVSLVFGNIRSDFNHAFETEEYLKGKTINKSTLKESLQLLLSELKPVQNDDIDLTVDSKNDLSLSVFYKFFLNLIPDEELEVSLRSAKSSLNREISSGTQTYTTNVKTYPISQPIPKISSNIQTSSEAYYLSDLPSSVNEVHCAFVLSDVGNADIDQIDISSASEQKGFVQIITGSNFPNEVKNQCYGNFDNTRPLLAVEHIDYAGQPIALVIAETEKEAREIAGRVNVTYKNKQQNILSTRDAIKNNLFYPLDLEDIVVGDPDDAIKEAEHKISGSIDLESQYHFYLENQISRVKKNDFGGFEIESATQSQRFIQTALSEIFSISSNKIEIKSKRMGGAFGGKATNSIIIAVAASLAAHVTGRPARFHADLKTCMSALGGRLPYSLDYTIGFNKCGVIEGLDWKVFTNSGSSVFDNEANEIGIFMFFADNAYYCPNRRLSRFSCKTNLASGTWCRGPGSLQLTAFADVMLEHVADYLQKDPIDIKIANFYQNGQRVIDGSILTDCTISEMCSSLVESTEVNKRKDAIKQFNLNNKWKKKGLALTPMKYPISWDFLMKYNVLLSVNAIDGSVVVSHGGIESGQGINTKLAQVVAFGLDIPLDMIIVQRTSTITSANSEVTGSSTTSEMVCRSAVRSCEIIQERIKTIRSKLPSDTSWADLIKKCDIAGVDLTVSCTLAPPETTGVRYNIWGVTATEVELDILTGQHIIQQVDLLQDCGISMNPLVDVGQVEGAFVMSLGFWLNESMIYDRESGRLLSDGTWEYKPPTTKDIPVKWNVNFLKQSDNPKGVYNSKATGEPSLCMGVSVAHALRYCVDSSLIERRCKNGFTWIEQPLTPINIKKALRLDPSKDFNLA